MTRMPITPDRAAAGPGGGHPIAGAPVTAARPGPPADALRAAAVRDLRTRAGHDLPRADLDFLWRALIT